MIIPIGHENETVRRLPWITFGIMAICLLALVASRWGSPTEEASAAVEAALEFYFDHPYLELDPRLDELLFAEVPEDQREELKAAVLAPFDLPGDPALREKEQATLDALSATALEGIDDIPFRRFGLVPANPTALTWITHLFMHAGWIHLLGNLLILYLAGPFIEDVWGRPVFASFYLLAGLFGSFLFYLKGPDSMIPLIGASGAISGVMGAFLVRYGSTRIRFFYVFGLVFRGTFDAPAWLMLPLWFCQQLFMAMMTEGIPGGGVAYWAHIGGFVFGAGVGLAFAKFEIEERWLRPGIDQKTAESVLENRVVEEAMSARAGGAPEQAYEKLAAECRANRGNIDAALAYWSLAVEMDRADEAAPAMLAAIRQELRAGQEDLAIEHWADVRARVPEAKAGIDLLVRLATALHRRGAAREAAAVLRQAMLEGGGGMTGAAALRIASAAREVDRRLSQAALQIALGNPELDPTERARAVELRESLRAASRDAGLPMDDSSKTA
jgi:membrane associated rhomboid family serine protease